MNPVITQHNTSRGGRYYTVEGDKRVAGVRLASVTTILNVVDKPFLLPWYKKLVRDQLSSYLRGLFNFGDGNILKQDGIIEFDLIDNIVNNAGDSERDSAADIGTETHKMIENYQLTGDKPSAQLDSASVRAFYSYVNWQMQSGIALVLSEQTVYHPYLHYAGTIDGIGVDKEGRTVILDWKSGNRVYANTALQLSAYAVAWYNMNAGPQMSINDVRAIAVRLDKDTGQFEVKEVDDIIESFKLFTAAQDLHTKLKDTKEVSVWKRGV